MKLVVCFDVIIKEIIASIAITCFFMQKELYKHSILHCSIEPYNFFLQTESVIEDTKSGC